MARYAGRREVLAALGDPQSDDSTMGVPEGVLPPDLLLGKATSIPSAYAPDVLVPILRSIARAQLGVELADFEMCCDRVLVPLAIPDLLLVHQFW